MRNPWLAIFGPALAGSLTATGWSTAKLSRSWSAFLRGVSAWPDYMSALHDSEEVGRSMLARAAKRMGLRPEHCAPGHAPSAYHRGGSGPTRCCTAPCMDRPPVLYGTVSAYCIVRPRSTYNVLML
jgi:hypothetical protein